MYELGIGGDEVPCYRPQGGERARVVEDGHVEAVDQIVFGEEGEWVVGDRTEEVHVWLDAPVVGIGGQGGVVVEEAGLPTDHLVGDL